MLILPPVQWLKKSDYSSLLSTGSQTVLYSYRQMRKAYKIKFTDKLKSNLWIDLDLVKVHRLKELTSPYIVSYLHFLNLNNILTLPKLSPSLKLRLIWHDLCLSCFLPARFRACAPVYEIKTNAMLQPLLLFSLLTLNK